MIEARPQPQDAPAPSLAEDMSALIRARVTCGTLRPAQRLLLTTPPSPRARPADELATGIAAAEPTLPGLAHLTIEPDPLSALRCALRTTPADGRLLIYGSLFLLGALRAHWHSEPRDPVALSDPGPKPSPAPLPHNRQ